MELLQEVVDELGSWAECRAGLLDRHYPAWYHLVDLRTLDMVCGGSCVYGQLRTYGRMLTGDLFRQAMSKLRDVASDSMRPGFIVPATAAPSPEDREPYWEWLRAKWESLIRARRQNEDLTWAR